VGGGLALVTAQPKAERWDGLAARMAERDSSALASLYDVTAASVHGRCAGSCRTTPWPRR
jgi:hypothetical protein